MAPGPNRTGVFFYRSGSLQSGEIATLTGNRLRGRSADMNDRQMVVSNMNFMRDVRQLTDPVYSDLS